MVKEAGAQGLEVVHEEITGQKLAFSIFSVDKFDEPKDAFMTLVIPQLVASMKRYATVIDDYAYWTSYQPNLILHDFFLKDDEAINLYDRFNQIGSQITSLTEKKMSLSYIRVKGQFIMPLPKLWRHIEVRKNSS